MPRVITLINVRITEWTVNLSLENVTVSYEILDDAGEVYCRSSATFWKTLPTGVASEALQWYVLPAAHVTAITELTVAARTALLHLIGE